MVVAHHHRRGWLWFLSGRHRTGGRPTDRLYGGARPHCRVLDRRWFGYVNAVFDTQSVREAGVESGPLFGTVPRAACRFNQISHLGFAMGPGDRLHVSERGGWMGGPGMNRSDADQLDCSLDVVLSIDHPWLG